MYEPRWKSVTYGNYGSAWQRSDDPKYNPKPDSVMAEDYENVLKYLAIGLFAADNALKSGRYSDVSFHIELCKRKLKGELNES